MAIKIGLLGFGTVASGIPFLLKENGEKITAAAKDDFEIAILFALALPIFSSLSLRLL